MQTHKDGLILVAHRIPADVTPVSAWLADVAERVVLITSEEAAPGYAGQFGEVIPVADYSTSDAVVHHLDRLCAEHAVSSIVHGTEDDILRLARVRDRHGIPGLCEADALVFRDKYAMKEAASAGVATPEFLIPSSSAEILAFVERVGLPLVVKPRLGSGSRGVTVVREHAALLAELDDRKMGETLLEAYLPGRVHHVDGFMRRREVLLAVPSQYVNSCLSFADGVSLGSVQMDDGDPLTKRLVEFAERTVAALPATGLTPFHLEVFVHEDTGDLYFCEIGARLGGGHIYETFTLLTGINPVEVWFREQAGLGSREVCAALEPGRYGWILVPPQQGTLEEIAELPLPEAVMERHLPDGLPRTFAAATGSTDAVASFVVRGADANAVESELRRCAQWAVNAMRWSA